MPKWAAWRDIWPYAAVCIQPYVQPYLSAVTLAWTALLLWSQAYQPIWLTAVALLSEGVMWCRCGS